MEQIKNRSEILFLYDVKDANPNGDPVDENKPRIDEETGINIVTDVRLKRTIRDFLYEQKGMNVFVYPTYDNEKLRTKEDRSKDFDDNEERIKNECIDIRLFGATTAVKKKTMTLTGPVQFKFGRSLHPVDLKFYKGTTIMPSEAGKEQGTFWERYILPYSLIAFYGIVNENAVRTQNIPLTKQDLELMYEAMWNGTKNLISGSKFGQMPRLLIEVVYKEGENFHIGELDKLISLKTKKEPREIRDVSEFKIEISPLVETLKSHKEKIEKVRFKVDDRLQLTINDYDTDLKTAFSFVELESFNF
jgi:CRISPR-associated protein Csh2